MKSMKANGRAVLGVLALFLAAASLVAAFVTGPPWFRFMMLAVAGSRIAKFFGK